MRNRNNVIPYIWALLIGMTIISFLGIYSSSETVGVRQIITSARSAVLYVPETKDFLYLKNPDERLPMASTTKIMTALVAIESCQLNEYVTVDHSAVGIEGSSAYLKEGEVLTVEQLLYALMLQSANDAATALAIHISGSIEEFASVMTERAKQLGAINTSFTNSHGLDDEQHYTTARDLALIAAEALSNECFLQIVSTTKKSFDTELTRRTFINHNKLLWRYEGCIGVKTGYTKRSGRCLVGAAEKNGLKLISVTLDAPNDWADHSAMLDYGFDTLEKITLVDSGELEYLIPVIGGINTTLKVTNTDSARVILPCSDNKVSSRLSLSRFAVAPVNKGDIFGEMVYTVNGKEYARVKLIATEDIQTKNNNNFFKRFFSFK